MKPLTKIEQALAHEIIAYLFDRPVRDMGGGLRIISLSNQWLPADQRDLIVRVLRDALTMPESK